MQSIPELRQADQPAIAPVDLSYRAIGRLSQPEYRLALLRADCLLREFLHGRVKISMKGEKGRSTHPILADDVPPVLLGFTSGVFTTPPAGIRVQGPQDDPGMRLIRYYAKHHRLALETEDVVTHTTRLGVVDFDGGTDHSDPLRDPLGAARDTITHLKTLGWPSYLVRSNSGAGYHLYLFFQQPIPSIDARRLLNALLRIDDDERAKVEIYPLDWDGQHGSLIHLPWWAYSKPGCNAFIDPDTEAEILLPDGGRFQRITPTQVADLLSTLPPPPMPVKIVAMTADTATASSSRPSSSRMAAPSRVGTASAAMASWRQQVQGDPRVIDAVYGNYLTGTQRGPWLECRDPASPTGDRTPSAGVHQQNGVFFSHRRHARGVSIFDMMLELGQAHTIGDAYRRAEEITGLMRPARTAAPSWRPADKYVKPADAPTPDPPDGFPLEEARAMLREIVDEEILPRVIRRQPGAFLLQAGTGVGKSQALVELVTEIAAGTLGSGPTPLRALWLTDSKENRDTLVRKHLQVYHHTENDEEARVVVAHARSPKSHDPGYCRQYALAQFLAGRRQPIKETICRRCESEAVKVAKRAWKRLSPDEQAQQSVEDLTPGCPYLEQRAHYKTTPVVVGTQQSFQFGGDLIEGFDLVVVDEKAVEMFFTDCEITAADIAQWETRQEKDPELWAVLRPVLSLLKQALVTGKAEGVTVPPHGMPLIPLLRQLAPDLDDLVERLWHRFPCDRWGIATKFDAAEKREVWQRRVAPLLILRTLVNLLVEECRRGTARDTQCWLLPPSETEPARLHLSLIREDLLQSLQRCVVVFLDATAHVPTLQRLWRRQIREYHIPVQAPCYTTIFSDLLYHAQQITGDPDREARLLQAIHRICAHAAQPMIVGEKALVKHWEHALPTHARVTYWGAADMAGSNRYSDCDCFIGIGHPRGTDTPLIRQTVAARAFAGNREPLPEGYDHFATARMPTPYTGYRDADGQAWMRMVTYPVDPEASDRAVHQYAAQLIQAIGRVRPANPRPYPVPIYLFTGEAPCDWRIDAMATLETWLADRETRPWETKFDTFQQAGARANVQRAGATEERYLDAGRRLHTEGKRISVRSLQREVGGCKKTAQKYYPAVLHALAIPAPQPFTRPILSLEREDPSFSLYQRAFHQYPGALPYWEKLTPDRIWHWWTIERFQDAYTGRRVVQPQEIAEYARALPVLAAHTRQCAEELARLDTMLAVATPMPMDELTEADYWRMVDEEGLGISQEECAFEAWWHSLTMEEKTLLVDEKCRCAA